MSLRINSWIRQVGAIMLFGITCLCFAQGTIVLNNRTPTGDVRIYNWDNSGPGSLPEGATAQLFLIHPDGTPTALFPSTTFRTNPAAATYFVNQVLVTVPGFPAGSQVTVQLRAWYGQENFPPSSWIWGASNPLTVTLGGQTGQGELQPATLSGMQSFTISPLTPTQMWFTSFSIQDDTLAFGINVIRLSPPYRDYLLEASENFADWQPLMTNPPPTFSIPYDSASQNVRFFRLRTP